MSKVEILMATYNGEKYLESQLYSIISQTQKDWTLLVHDDGSTDRTVEIIRTFQKRDSRIVFLEDNIKCGGPGANFLHLLHRSSGEYVMFCDQDDIWFESKLAIHLKAIQQYEQPFAVYSNGYTYDGEVIKTKNFVEFHRTCIQDSIFLNGGIHGCCIMMNRKLVRIAQNNSPDYIYMHDHFITMLAVTFGTMNYIDKALMLYRQHDQNVTGNVNVSFISRLKTFIDAENPVLEKRHYQANASFYQCFKNQMPVEDQTLFEAYLSFPKASKFQRLAIVLRNKFKAKSVFQLLIKTLLRKAI